MISFSLFTGLSYGMNSVVYCGMPCIDRMEKRKYLLNALGLRNWAYWVGTFCVEFFFYMITIALLFIAIYFADLEALREVYFELLLQFMIFGCCIIQFGNFMSFRFKYGPNAFRYYSILNFTIFFIIPGAVLYLSLIHI